MLQSAHIAQKTRRLMIDIARRRQRPGTGSNWDMMMKNDEIRRWPPLQNILRVVNFAVVGAVATRLYMPERVTRDIAILVEETDLPRAAQALQFAQWELLGALSIGGQTWRAPDGVTVDVLAGSEKWCRAAIAAAQNQRDAQGLPILPLPYLVLMKFRASRTIDIGDIARMLSLANDTDLAATRELFERFEPEGWEDLDSLVELGRLEMQSE